MNLNGRKLGAGCSPCAETATRPTNSCDPRKVISITRAGDKIIVALNDCTFLTADNDTLDPSITGGNSGKCECGKEIAELEKKITELEKKIPTEHKEPKELGELVPVYNAKGELSYYAHAAPAERGDPVPPPDLPSPPEKEPKWKDAKPPKKSKVEIEFFVDGASTYKINLEGEVGTVIPRDEYNAKLKEYTDQGKELATSTFAEGEVFPEIDYTQYYMAKLRTAEQSTVTFKVVEAPEAGSLLDPSSYTLGDLTGNVGSEIPRGLYDSALRQHSADYDFVRSDFVPPMYFPAAGETKVFTILFQRKSTTPNPSAPDGPNDPMEPRV